MQTKIGKYLKEFFVFKKIVIFFDESFFFFLFNNSFHYICKLINLFTQRQGFPIRNGGKIWRWD